MTKCVSIKVKDLNGNLIVRATEQNEAEYEIKDNCLFVRGIVERGTINVTQQKETIIVPLSNISTINIVDCVL